LYNEKTLQSYYIPGIIIENLSDTKYGCYNLTDGYVKLRLEARGYGAVIGEPNESISLEDCIIKIPDLMKSGSLKPEMWELDQRYFKTDTDNKIITVCGRAGWENISIII